MYARCGACQQRMVIDEDLLGQLVACPECGTHVRIPGAVAPVIVPPVVTRGGTAAAVMPVQTPPALVHRCPKCRADVEHGNTLCPRCGVNIKRYKRRR